jgi:phosphomannomutase
MKPMAASSWAVRSQEGRTLAALPTRDAVLPMLAVLAQARRSGLSVSALRATLPPRFTASDRLQNYPTAKSQALVARLGEGEAPAVLAKVGDLFGSFAGPATLFNQVDGLRITFASGDIIHLRPSGNAPELRVYTEGTPRARATCSNRRWRSWWPAMIHDRPSLIGTRWRQGRAEAR